VLDIALFIATLMLVVLAISGYDKYIAAKVRAKIVRDRIQVRMKERDEPATDAETRMRIKKVRAAKVGSYLIVTLVISEGGKRGEKIEVDDPALLLPLMGIDEEENAVTS